jgi:hypothetical protein
MNLDKDILCGLKCIDKAKDTGIHDLLVCESATSDHIVLKNQHPFQETVIERRV